MCGGAVLLVPLVVAVARHLPVSKSFEGTLVRAGRGLVVTQPAAKTTGRAPLPTDNRDAKAAKRAQKTARYPDKAASAKRATGAEVPPQRQVG